MYGIFCAFEFFNFQQCKMPKHVVCGLYLPTFTPVSLKLWSHAKSRLQTNFARLTHKCELLSVKWPIYHRKMHSEKCKLDPIWERNSPCKWHFDPRFTDFEGKKPKGLSFFSRSQTHRETSKLRNSSERPRKFPEIFGNSRIIFGNSDILQDKNLTPLAQKNLKVGQYMWVCVVLLSQLRFRFL